MFYDRDVCLYIHDICSLRHQRTTLASLHPSFTKFCRSKPSYCSYIRRYFRCKFQRICNATLIMEANGRSKISRPHSDYCHPDEQAEFEAIFKQALKDSLSTHWYKLKELYDGLALV